MNDIIIRKVRKEDISDVVDININDWKIAYRGIIDDDYLDNLENRREEKIKKMLDNYLENNFYVAILNNQVVGFCRWCDDNSYSPDIPGIDCELSALYVKYDLKEKGIGTKLFQYVKKDLKSKGKKKMILWCFKDNEPSKKFYSKMGGKIITEGIYSTGGKDYKTVGIEFDI